MLQWRILARLQAPHPAAAIRREVTVAKKPEAKSTKILIN